MSVEAPHGLAAGESLAPGLNVHLQQLAYLRALYRAGSVTQAAEWLHVSQPALSQALSELERRVGMPLFERRGRRRDLTPAGRELLDFAEKVLAQASDLRGRLEARQRGQGGRLRVGMIDAASLYVLPEAVRRFRRDRPHVELALTVASSSELLEDLRRHTLDLVFVVGPADEDLRCREVRRESLYLYAPAGGASEPSEAEWVLYPEASRTRRLIDEAFAREGIRPRITLESGSPEVLRQMVALGFGWSVLPQAVAESGPSPLRRGRKKRLAERVLLAATRRDAPSDPLVEALLEEARGLERGGE